MTARHTTYDTTPQPPAIRAFACFRLLPPASAAAPAGVPARPILSCHAPLLSNGGRVPCQVVVQLHGILVGAIGQPACLRHHANHDKAEALVQAARGRREHQVEEDCLYMGSDAGLRGVSGRGTQPYLRAATSHRSDEARGEFVRGGDQARAARVPFSCVPRAGRHAPCIPAPWRGRGRPSPWPFPHRCRAWRWAPGSRRCRYASTCPGSWADAAWCAARQRRAGDTHARARCVGAAPSSAGRSSAGTHLYVERSLESARRVVREREGVVAEVVLCKVLEGELLVLGVLVLVGDDLVQQQVHVRQLLVARARQRCPAPVLERARPRQAAQLRRRPLWLDHVCHTLLKAVLTRRRRASHWLPCPCLRARVRHARRRGGWSGARPPARPRGTTRAPRTRRTLPAPAVTPGTQRRGGRVRHRGEKGLPADPSGCTPAATLSSNLSRCDFFLFFFITDSKVPS